MAMAEDGQGVGGSQPRLLPGAGAHVDDAQKPGARQKWSHAQGYKDHVVLVAAENRTLGSQDSHHGEGPAGDGDGLAQPRPSPQLPENLLAHHGHVAPGGHVLPGDEAAQGHLVVAHLLRRLRHSLYLGVVGFLPRLHRGLGGYGRGYQPHRLHPPG